MTQEQKIIDRIRKVLAKANGTNNPAEAEMLMAKVHEMLSEHNLTLTTVAESSDDPIGKSEHFAHHAVNDSWMGKLTNAIAKYYGCRLIRFQVGPNKWAYSMAGRESARVTVELMTPFIKKQIQKLARDAVAEGQYANVRIAQRRIGNALMQRIFKLVHEAERADRDRVARGENALVPVDLVDAAFESYWPDVIKGRRTTSVTDAYSRDAANKVSLHRQTGGAQTLRIK